MTGAPLVGTRYVGRPMTRREDGRHLSGRARFAGDFAEPGQLHAAFVRSTEPHAHITHIATAEALALDGVVAVLTAKDLEDYPQMPVSWVFPDAAARLTPPTLFATTAKYVGDAIALVVATDPYIAADAIELIAVDYDPLPAVSDARHAAELGAPLVHDHVEGNVSFDRHIVIGDISTAFAEADAVAEADIRNQRLVPSPLEPRSTSIIHDPYTGNTTAYLSTQAPHVVKSQLSHVSRIPEHKLRVVAPAVGGGFGAKLAFYREDAVLTITASRLGRSVHWVESRSENVVAMTHGRDHHQHVRVAARADGTILGLEVDCHANLGAYLSSMGQGVPGTNFAIMVGGNYVIPNLDLRIRGMLTNTTPTDTYRGAGRPEATYLTERVIELVARSTGVPATEVRRKNFMVGLPQPNAVGLITYDSGDYHETYDALLDALDLDAEHIRQQEYRANGRYLGIGTAMYVEFTGAGPSSLNKMIGFNRAGYDQTQIRMHPDGKATLFSGLSSHGQGHFTTLAQIVADRLHLPPDDVEVVQSDTQLVPFGIGTWNSRSMPVGAGSVVAAADRVVDKARVFAAELLEADDHDVELTPAGFGVRGTPARTVSWAEVSALAFAGGSGRGTEPGLEAIAAFDPTGLTCSYGAHAAVVEVDPETGEVRLDRILVVDDCGTILNPLIATGQIHGGLAQGIGQALYESMAYDDTGQPAVGGFMHYCIPRAEHFPVFETHHTVHPSPLNPLGVKGVGEAGTIGITPAVHAAVLDAIAPLGVDELEMPLTPARIWAAIDATGRAR
jgi:aerobic carbon-monoxide dehydrogenase large subunit